MIDVVVIAQTVLKQNCVIALPIMHLLLKTSGALIGRSKIEATNLKISKFSDIIIIES